MDVRRGYLARSSMSDPMPLELPSMSNWNWNWKLVHIIFLSPIVHFPHPVTINIAPVSVFMPINMAIWEKMQPRLRSKYLW